MKCTGTASRRRRRGVKEEEKGGGFSAVRLKEKVEGGQRSTGSERSGENLLPYCCRTKPV
jgi:hypothetical protein